MEYTKDMVFSIKYKNSKKKSVIKEKHKWLEKIVEWIQKDEYFTVVILMSIVVLTIDFFVVKKFIQIIKLLP